MQKTSLLVILSLIASFVFAQTPWVRTYGGGNEEKGNSLILAPDSGFYVVGYTGSMGNGASDMYILKTDSLGQFQWQKTIGTPNIDIAEKIVKGNNANEYFIAGYSNGVAPYDYNFYFAKIDAFGDTIKTNYVGTTEWDLCYSAIATGDGYIMVGETFANGNGGTNGYLIKVNENLDSLATFIYSSSDYTVFNDIIQINANKFLVVGTATNPLNDSSDAMVWTFDASGNILDTMRINYGKNEFINCAAASYGNGIMLGGFFHYDSTHFSKSLQIKLNDSATVEMWHLMAPEVDDYGLEINSYAHLGNDAFILAGESRYKYNDDNQAVIIRSYPDGFPFFNKESGIIFPKDGFFGIVKSADGGIVATGYTRSYGPGIQALMLSKFGEWGATSNNAIVSNEEVENDTQNWKVYPNPTQQWIMVDSPSAANFTLLDLSGRNIKSGKFTTSGTFQVSLDDLAPGIYIMNLTGHNSAFMSFKIVKN